MHLTVDSLLAVYVKRWHRAHPPATYRDIIIMSLYEPSYQVGLSWSPPRGPVCADASDAGGRRWWKKKICPNIYSNWQLCRLTMQPRTDSTNLTNLCVGCKQMEDNDSPSACPSAFLLSCHGRHLQRINVKGAEWSMLWTVWGLLPYNKPEVW